jgi:hypothetical protein
MNDRAVGSGKVSAADVARFVFDAIGREALLHLQPSEGARQRADAPRGHHAGAQPDRSVRRQAEIGAELRAALRAAS